MLPGDRVYTRRQNTCTVVLGELNISFCNYNYQDYFTRTRKMDLTLKYIDPTYMIRAIPSNASDNVYCTLLAHSAIHGAMAGYTGFTVGLVNGRHAYIPFYRITETQNKVVITDRMWARLLSSTNQPSFVNYKDAEVKTKRDSALPFLDPVNDSDDGSSCPSEDGTGSLP